MPYKASARFPFSDLDFPFSDFQFAWPDPGRGNVRREPDLIPSHASPTEALSNFRAQQAGHHLASARAAHGAVRSDHAADGLGREGLEGMMIRISNAIEFNFTSQVAGA